MPKRERWTPVKGTALRIYDPRERFLVKGLDAILRAFVMRRRAQSSMIEIDRSALRRVLVLRLDRIGDVIMSLPAIADLRAALPQARIVLAVGAWSAEIARSATVDELLIWNAPWVGRPNEGAHSLLALLRNAWSMRRCRFDVAIDLQGDIRASLLLWLSGAKVRVGYANTGGASLLTDIVELDETVSWVEQNRNAIHRAIGRVPAQEPPFPLEKDEQERSLQWLGERGLLTRRPLVGLHPSGGRRIKQWDLQRWTEVARRLQHEHGATILITGAANDGPLAAQIMSGLTAAAFDLTGRLRVRDTLALIAALDLFLSSDTGPMHMACAVGTPSIGLFGPSDPIRYFSGPHLLHPARHRSLGPRLWCSPCNLIRKPPRECLASPPPECLRLIDASRVVDVAVELLESPSATRR